MLDSRKLSRGSLSSGIGLSIAVTPAIYLVVAFGFQLLISDSRVINSIAESWLFYPGLWQIIWNLPFYLWYRKHDQPKTAKGILIGSGIVALLNASCGGIVRIAVRA